MSRRPPALARLAALVLLGAVCVGCSSDEEPTAPDPSPQAASSDSITDPGVTTEDNGKSVTTYQGVPPGYPEAEVPLLDEDEIVSGSTTEYDKRTAYSVIVESDLPAGEALAAATDLFAETDLELVGPGPSGDGAPVTYTADGGDLFVIVLADPFEPGSTLNYTVEVK